MKSPFSSAFKEKGMEFRVSIGPSLTTVRVVENVPSGVCNSLKPRISLVRPELTPQFSAVQQADIGGLGVLCHSGHMALTICLMFS